MAGAEAGGVVGGGGNDSRMNWTNICDPSMGLSSVIRKVYWPLAGVMICEFHMYGVGSWSGRNWRPAGGLSGIAPIWVLKGAMMINRYVPWTRYWVAL